MAAWSDTELAELQAYNILRNTVGEEIPVVTSFKMFHLLIDGKIPSGFIDLDVWKWAFAHANRGSIKLPFHIWKIAKGYKASEEDERRHGLAFYPLLETVKHCPVKDTTRDAMRIGGEKKPVLVMHADRRFADGEEICFDRGSFSNLRLIYQEGRTAFPNPYDYYIHTIQNDNPEYCEDLIDLDTCSFKITLTLSDEMLLYARASTSHSTAVQVQDDYAVYYGSLNNEVGENKGNFVKSVLKYRKEFRRNILQPLYNMPMREVRRLAEKEPNGHLQTAYKLGETGLQMLYKHLEATDRLLLHIFAIDIGL